jgi:hypothetical protein
MQRAQELGVNLNSLVKMFVKEEDFVVIKKDIMFEKMFDRGIKKAFLSKEGKKRAKMIAEKLAKV